MPRVKATLTLAILTSGGDSPGMNTAIWAATQQLEDTGWRVLGVRGGFAGILSGDFLELNASECLKFARYGGTFLGTSRDPDFAQKIPAALKQLKKAGVTHLLVLGGNGSLRGAAALEKYSAAALQSYSAAALQSYSAAALEKMGFPVVGLPATIDNDVAGSDDSIGFDSATSYGLQILDQFRDTLEALPRLCVLETLGGDTGFLADRIGRVGGADAVLVPEIQVSVNMLAAISSDAIQRRGFAVIVASEGVPNLEPKLLELEKLLDLRLRFARPSHSMRGGKPSAHDRNLAYDLATAGVNALAKGQTGMIAWKNGAIRLVAFSSLPAKKRFTRKTPGG